MTLWRHQQALLVWIFCSDRTSIPMIFWAVLIHRSNDFLTSVGQSPSHMQCSRSGCSPLYTYRSSWGSPALEGSSQATQYIFCVCVFSHSSLIWTPRNLLLQTFWSLEVCDVLSFSSGLQPSPWSCWCLAWDCCSDTMLPVCHLFCRLSLHYLWSGHWLVSSVNIMMVLFTGMATQSQSVSWASSWGHKPRTYLWSWRESGRYTWLTV